MSRAQASNVERALERSPEIDDLNDIIIHKAENHEHKSEKTRCDASLCHTMGRRKAGITSGLKQILGERHNSVAGWMSGHYR